ncbi:unnamed protein product [Darwinula stevensoni]|uniref:SAM domain-containing protein n=1 Tax=Darwinula stevensoni TaxID=69355 RepID=A0A7R9A2B1_9CRUS|nr:unnamed protein product [Darwinula stevensoni]CAG0889316.1 unnamed protein product [Darwinula stevensoni]
MAPFSDSLTDSYSSRSRDSLTVYVDEVLIYIYGGVCSAKMTDLQKCVICPKRAKTLKFIIPNQKGEKKAFCSPNCMLSYKRANKKGVCVHCDNPMGEESGGSNICKQCRNKSSDRSHVNGTQEKAKVADGVKFECAAFVWDTYLHEAHSKPAPPRFFKQSIKPLKNEFRAKMKLEARDPRNLSSTCIATVIGTTGPRLRLRLDGGDDRNDFWRLVNSSDIQPVGTCEKSGNMLQPPLGFQRNSSNFHTFLSKTLKDADIAPASAFYPEPSGPDRNLFETGLKLEAVDKKNPHLICVASVGKVENDLIYVTFDGWKDNYGYYCRFDSRDIFPVGWCERNSHPLQPPYDRWEPWNKSKRILTSPALIPVSPASASISMLNTSSDTTNNNNNDNNDTLPLSPSPVSSLRKRRKSPSSAMSNKHSSNEDDSEVKVDVVVSQECGVGSYLNTEKARKVFPPAIGPVSIMDAFASIMQCLVDAAIDQKSVFTFVRQGSSLSTVTAKFGGRVHRMNLPQVETESQFWEQVNLITGELGMCPNFFRPQASSVCTLCKVHPSLVDPSPTPAPAPSPKTPVEPTPKSSRTNHHPQRRSKRKQEENSTPDIAEEVKVTRLDRISHPVTTKILVKAETKTSSAPRGAGAEVEERLPKDPSEWSVGNVMQHIQRVDPSLGQYKDLFAQHEIDGRAFLLLTCDTMMKYMNLKLGPAIKIANIVEQLNRRH